MKAGRAVAIGLIIIALALGGAACGGGGHPKKKQPSAAAQARAAAHWRAGLRLWHTETIGALDGMSVQLSTPASLGLLQHRNPAADARLAGFERTLETCSLTIRKLGAVPAGLEIAHEHAVRACKNLEVGAKLVEKGVQALRQGRGGDLFNEATDPLGAGQNEIVAASAAMRTSTS